MGFPSESDDLLALQEHVRPVLDWLPDEVHDDVPDPVPGPARAISSSRLMLDLPGPITREDVEY